MALDLLVPLVLFGLFVLLVPLDLLAPLVLFVLVVLLGAAS